MNEYSVISFSGEESGVLVGAWHQRSSIFIWEIAWNGG